MYLYFEAINFDATIFDTNNLATMRGGSMAMEAMPRSAFEFLKKRFSHVEDFGSGASKATFRIGKQTQIEIESAAEDFLSSSNCEVICVTYGIGETSQIAKQQSVIRADQLWSIPLYQMDAKATGACALDHTRPATVLDKRNGQPDRMISVHCAKRREIGRNERPVLFQNSDLHPAQSFDEICGASQVLGDRLTNEVSVVADKLAVISIDGIGGSHLAKLVNAKPASGAKDRMANLTPIFYNAVAEELIAWAQKHQLTYEGFDHTGVKQRFARMDVLTWAGDDMLFFVPAYAAASFVKCFLDAIDRDFDPEENRGLRFHHRIGIAIGQRKVPVRQLIAVADMLQSSARGGPPDCSLVAMIALESAAPPNDSLSPYWTGLYGAGHTAEMEVFTESEYNAFSDACRLIATAGEDASISITQINRILRLLGVPRKELVPETKADQELQDTKASKALSDHFARVQHQGFDREAEFPGLGRRSLPLLLAQVTQFAPYIQASKIFEEAPS